MHGRVLVGGDDQGGGVLVSSQVVLTAAHVVGNARPREIAFVDADGSRTSHRVKSVTFGIQDVAALVLEGSLPCITQLGMPTRHSRWIAGARREAADNTIRGSVVAAGRLYQDASKRKCRVHEVVIEGSIESLSGYSGTALCLEDQDLRVFGMLIEEKQFEWLKRIGYNRSTGHLFALDIYDAIDCVRREGLASLLSETPQSHSEDVARSARLRPHRNRPDVETRSLFIAPIPGLATDALVRPWLTGVREHLSGLAAQCQPENLPSSVQTAESQLAGPVTVDTARDTLRGLRLDSLRVQITSQRRLPRQRALKIQNSIQNLKHLESRTASVITGITGPFGSGKSRVLAELEGELNSNGTPTIRLTNSDLQDVAPALLRHLRATLLIDAVNIGDLAEAFWRRSEPLVIVADDIDVAFRRAPERLDRFIENVVLMSAIPCVHWVVTADDSRLADLIPSTRLDFWPQYAVERSSPFPLSGWIDLRAQNINGRIGHRIIAGASPTSTAELKAAGRTIQETLANPLAAWLRVEHAHDTPITALNRSEFVSAYRQILVEDVDTLNRHGISTVTGQDLEIVMREIGVRLTSSKADSCVIRFSRAHQLDLRAETLRAALDLLSARGLILISRQHTSCTVGLKFVPLWALEVFLASKESALPAAGNWVALARDWKRAAIDSDLGEAVLTHIYSRSRPEIGGVNSDEWHNWSRSRDTNIAAFLEAGLPATFGTSEAIRRVARRRDIERLDERSRQRILFAILRYVGDDSCVCWRSSTRASVIGRFYPLYLESGLSEYCSYTIEKILQRGPRRQDCLQLAEAFLGSEAAGVADVAASKMVAVVAKTYHNTNSFADFIQSVVEGSRRFAESAANSRVGPGTKDSFARLFVRELTDVFVERSGLDSFKSVVERGLLGSRNSRFTEEFARGYVMSLGAQCFHSGSRETQARYINLVDQLLRRYGRLRQDEARRRALFLIRHSTPTGRQLEVVVDRRFYPALRILATDSELNDTAGRWYEPLLLANGISVPRIQHRRHRGRNGGRSKSVRRR